MKRVFLGVALVLCLAPNASAKMCALDTVPAATLLLPYFEVDLNLLNGRTTVLSINNADPQPVLASFTLWTDWGFATIRFDMFLTGYDVVTVNLRTLFNGNVPITADAQSDPDDLISPHGDYPSWDGSYTASPDCINFFPFYINPLIVGSNLERLTSSHTGVPVTAVSDQCTGSPTGDNWARGYITIDSVQRCSIGFPNEDGYFTGPSKVTNEQNSLWGDYFYYDPMNESLQAFPLVHIEADPKFDDQSTPSGATFYGRYTDGGADHREPLGQRWHARYNDGPFLFLQTLDDLFTDLIVWRDPATVAQQPVACGTTPDWVPLEQTLVGVFSDQEDVTELCTGISCLPLETQRLSASTGDLHGPYLYGFYDLDLSLSDRVSQSYVSTVQYSNEGWGGGLPAVELASACNTVIPTSGGVQ